MFVIDARSGEQTGNDPMGPSKTIAWPALIAALNKAGVIDKTATHLMVDGQGITVRLQSKK